MGWLLELLFGAINEMCSQFIVDMMDLASGMFMEILSCDLNLFESLFGVADDLYRSAVMPMGVMLLLMILVWQLFKSMFGKLGASSEDPVELVFRSAFCLFFILFAKDIVNYILEIAGTPYDWVVGTGIEVESFSQYVTVAEGVMSALGTDALSISILKLILQFVIAWNYFKMLFILSERYVLLGIFSYTSPLAFAMGGSKATNNVLASWTKMFGGQVVIVILDAWCVKMFLSAYGNMMASSYGFTKFFAANLCLIGFCKITAKLDSYMGSLGVNLGRIGGGMSGLGALLMAGRLLNFGGGRRGTAAGTGGNGPMSFGPGRPIPMRPGPTGFGGGMAAGNTGTSGSSIPGMDTGGFGETGAKPAETEKKPWEEDGFGAFGMDYENGMAGNLPFGAPEAEKGAAQAGSVQETPAFGGAGAEHGPFDLAENWQEDMAGAAESAGEDNAALPFGSEPDYGAGNIPMSQLDGEEFTDMQDMETQPDGMAAEALEEGFGIPGMDSGDGAAAMDYGLEDTGGQLSGISEGICEGLSGDGVSGLANGESVIGADGGNGTLETAGAAGLSEIGGAAGAGEIAEAGGISEWESSNIGTGKDADVAAEGRNGEPAGHGFGIEVGTGAGIAAGTAISTGDGLAGERGLSAETSFRAGNREQAVFQTQAGAGAMNRAVEMAGAYPAERDGERYMRYDASRYEKPQGNYQTIHENGKTYYELPEGEKAPAVLPETKASLEKDGTIRLEQVYRESRTEPGKEEKTGGEGLRLTETPFRGNTAAGKKTPENQAAGNPVSGRRQKTNPGAGKKHSARENGRRKERKGGGA